MTYRLTAALSAVLLAACSSPSSEELSAVVHAESDGLSTLPGPTRLRGRCTFDDWPAFFEVDAGGDPARVGLGTLPGGKHVNVEISVGRAPDYAVTLKTLKSGGFAPDEESVVVAVPSVEVGGSVALEDTTLRPGHAVTCNATLVQKPMLFFLGEGGDAVPLASLTTPLLSLDLVLPGRMSCGVAFRFPTDGDPLPPWAVADIVGSFELTGGQVDVTREDDRTLVFRTPDQQQGWDAMFSIESSGHTGPIADMLRAMFHLPAAPAPIGTLEVLRCPPESR